MHTLRFAVQDSGIGISTDNASLLFTNFTQLDTTPSKAYGGTGLGLSISRQLAELLGGEIGVLSDEGEGSVFWFTISCPRGRGRGPARRRARCASSRASSPLTRRPACCWSTTTPSTRRWASACSPSWAARWTWPAAAPRPLRWPPRPDASYDIIFMDIQMPDMDGVAATAEIRRRLGAACPPVVAMTAYSMQEDAGRFMRQGLDDYVGKPVKSRHLYEVLHRWLRPRPRAAATRQCLRRRRRGSETQPLPCRQQLPPPARCRPPSLRCASEPRWTKPCCASWWSWAGPNLPPTSTRSLSRKPAICCAMRPQWWPAANFRELLPMLHQLKGTAATLGGVALAAQARHLEHQFKEGRMEEGGGGFSTSRTLLCTVRGRIPRRR